MLVCTAITLIRRRIWYDAMLLFGLTNLFIIVPFSLISRAVFLKPHLALTMSIMGVAAGIGKFWAFKKYAPELNLPRRLLVIGALLLLVNAYAPLLFKRHRHRHRPSRADGLNFIWLFLLPASAGLALFLPPTRRLWRHARRKEMVARCTVFAWILVTACHFGGIGYSKQLCLNYSLLAPVAWVIAWAIYFSSRGFHLQAKSPGRKFSVVCAAVGPLLAMDSERILLFFCGP